jgi:protein CrcB
MNAAGFVAVGIGAALGAWLRWGFGVLLNPLLPTLPLGTLAANLIGGYLIGVAIEIFAQHSGIPPEVRLLIITGFLGGLTCTPAVRVGARTGGLAPRRLPFDDGAGHSHRQVVASVRACYRL